MSRNFPIINLIKVYFQVFEYQLAVYISVVYFEFLFYVLYFYFQLYLAYIFIIYDAMFFMTKYYNNSQLF